MAFHWKDYRAKGRTRYKTMTLEPGEFMRRFLLHVLPPMIVIEILERTAPIRAPPMRRGDT